MSCGNDNNGTEQQNCNPGPFERNNYFYGKLMTVRDFKAEQDYFNEKRHMLNRLIHGVGIVCGLEVKKNGATNTEGYIPIVIGDKTVYLSPCVALDCCGNEIVVSNNSVPKRVDGTFNNGTNYLYLKYSEEPTEKVPSVSNTSACDEECCDNRVREKYEISVNQTPPVSEVPVLKGEIRETDSKDIAQNYYETHLSTCPECNDSKVLLAVMNDKGVVNNVETFKYRSIVYNNPMIYELLGNHLTDFNNPHHVTAAQIDAIVSIEGLKNPGGNINLEKANAIIISTETPANADPVIRISEDHSVKTTNPHLVNHTQTSPLGWDNTPNGDKNKHISNNDALVWNKSINKITLNPGVSETNIEASGGVISIIAGDNVSITKYDENTFSISSAIPETNNYYEKDIELSGGESKNISHNFGKFPVVDIYELVEENKIWIGDNERVKMVADKLKIGVDIILLKKYMQSKNIEYNNPKSIQDFNKRLKEQQINVNYTDKDYEELKDITAKDWEKFLGLYVLEYKSNYYIKSLVNQTPQIDVIHRDKTNTDIVNTSETTLNIKVIMCA